MSDLINTNRLHVSAEQAMTSPTESGTPRTDALIGELVIEASSFKTMYYEALDYWNTMSEHARQLERELAEKQARIAELELTCKEFADDEVEYMKDLTAERQRAEGLVDLLRDARHRLGTYMDLRQDTYWDGCWKAHNDCNLLRQLDAALGHTQNQTESVDSCIREGADTGSKI